MAAGADIVGVGDFRLQHRVVATPQRQPPQRIVLARGRAHQLGGERVVVGEERRNLGAERDTSGAGQGREIDQQVGRFLVGERERVGQDQAAFGVGIADFDGEPLARAENVARAKAGAGDRVLDRRDQHA